MRYCLGGACIDCPDGSIAPLEGTFNCTVCPLEGGYYAANRTNCTTCPLGLEPTPQRSGCRIPPGINLQTNYVSKLVSLVPPKPENNFAVLMYCLVGISLLAVGGGIFAFVQWKRQNDAGSVGYQPLSFQE